MIGERKIEIIWPTIEGQRRTPHIKENKMGTE